MMDAFLQACGVQTALELEVNASGKVRSTRYCLRQPFAIIGRHPASDVYLDSDGVRPRHIYFQAIEGRIACINVSQTGSLQADDTPIEPFCWLKDNDSVYFGTRSIKLIHDDKEVVQRSDIIDPMAPGSAWDIFAPRITLEITYQGSQETKIWLVDRLLTLIGRTPRCAIQLHDEVISNVHCSLVLTTAGLWVVDLLGRGGLIINEQPVRVALLGPDDDLRVGPFQIQLHEAPPEYHFTQEEKEFHPITPAAEFDVPSASETESQHEVRRYHTPWPDDISNAEVLEELMEKLQEMQGPMFLEHQHVITRMIERFDKLQPDEQAVVKTELDRLRQLNDEVVTMEQSEEPQVTPENIVLPDELSYPQRAEETAEVDPTGLTPSGRSASLLLVGSRPALRIPTKSVDLFETVREQKIQGPEIETELPATESLSQTEPMKADIPAPQSESTEIEKAAHLRLHARINELRMEQSSIWQKLSKFIFGR